MKGLDIDVIYGNGDDAGRQRLEDTLNALRADPNNGVVIEENSGTAPESDRSPGRIERDIPNPVDRSAQRRLVTVWL